MSPVLYYFELSPYCRSVLMMARAVDVTLELRVINLRQGDHLKPEFLAINSQHTVPTLVDGDLVLWESRAILTYLLGRYGQDKSLYPEDPISRAKVDSLLYFDQGTLVPRWRDIAHPLMAGIFTKPPQGSIDKLHEALEWLERSIITNGGPYAAGTEHLTVADFALVACVSTYEVAGFFTSEKFPVTAAWLEKCKKSIQGYQELNGEGASKLGQFIQSLIKS